MRKLTYCDALNEAMHEEMARDDTVFIIGEDVDIHGGVFNFTRGIVEKFGPERCVGTPISEEGFVGLSVGAAATGLRPIVEIMYMDFIMLAMDQLINQMAKMRYMSGGQVSMPVTIRAQAGHGTAEAAQHSQSLGLHARHGLRRQGTPQGRHSRQQPGHRHREPPPPLRRRRGAGRRMDRAARQGRRSPRGFRRDRHRFFLGATQGAQGRTIYPLDMETILASIKKTGHVVVVHESPARCGIGAETVRRIVEEGFDYLDAPPIVHAGADLPIPFSPPLENACLPQPETIADACRKLVG